MKKTILIAALLIGAMGCRDKAPTPTPELKTIDHIPGTWQYADDRTIEIGQPESCSFPITFPFQIQSPIQQPITISYTYSGNDTIRLESGNIYPDCYFYLDAGHIKGMMQEYRNQPGQGAFIPITKIGD